MGKRGPKPRTAPFIPFIFSRCVVDSNGCWIWQRSLQNGGYAKVFTDGKMRLAHIVTHEEKHGPVPDGLELDHLCRVRHCVNPDHTEAVTHVENARRGLGGWNMLSKTHCIHGHPFDVENTYYWRTKRICRTCFRVRRRNQRERKKTNSTLPPGRPARKIA